MQPPHSIPPHSHAHGKCPITGQTFDWCPKQEDDYRSPCPALNTLANHGYINRNGKNIDPSDLVSAMEKVYGCSASLSKAIVYGGLIVLGQFKKISLLDIGRHNLIEHNASLTKRDADEARDLEYAPYAPDSPLLNELFQFSHDGQSLSLFDLSRARVERERSCRQIIDTVHQKIARGEMALILNVFGVDTKSQNADEPNEEQPMIPLNVAKTWFRDERLPHGWKPSRSVGIWDLLRDSLKIGSTMKEIRNNLSSSEEATSGYPDSDAVQILNPTPSTPTQSIIIASRTTSTHLTTNVDESMLHSSTGLRPPRSNSTASSITLVDDTPSTSTEETTVKEKYHLRVTTTNSSSTHLKVQTRLLEKLRDLKISTSNLSGHPMAQHEPLTPSILLPSASWKPYSALPPFDLASPLSPSVPLSAH